GGEDGTSAVARDSDPGLDDHVELALERDLWPLRMHSHLMPDRVAGEVVDDDLPLTTGGTKDAALDVDGRLDHRLVAGAGAVGGFSKLLQEPLPDAGGEHVVDHTARQAHPAEHRPAALVALQIADQVRDDRSQVPQLVPGVRPGIGGDLEERAPRRTLVAAEVAAEGADHGSISEAA